MPWFKVDDKFHSHEKAAAAGYAAIGAWTLAGSWCSDHLTDGRVPMAVAHRFAPARVWKRLVEAGLVEQREGAYQLHDFLVYNPRGDEARAARAELSAKRSAAGAKGAASRWQNDGKPVANAKQSDAPDPDPDPKPDPQNTHIAGARDPDPPEPEDPDTAAVLAELRRHPAVLAAARTTDAGNLAVLRLAELVASLRMNTGKPVAWYLAAVGAAVSAVLAEASGDVTPPTWEWLARRVESFARGARAPREDRPSGRGAPPPTDLEVYVGRRWVEARRRRKLAANEPDPRVASEVASIVAGAVAEAKPDREGWRPSGTEVVAAWIRRYLGETQERRGGVEDSGWPFAWLPNRCREYPLPTRGELHLQPGSATPDPVAAEPAAPPSSPRLAAPAPEPPPPPAVALEGLHALTASIGGGGATGPQPRATRPGAPALRVIAGGEP